MVNSTIEIIRINIKKYRIEEKLTQEKLSGLADISCDYLSELERGRKIPSIKRLDMIAKALKIEPYKLLKQS